MRRLILPVVMALALAGCGKTYGNADCVETKQTAEGDRSSIVWAYIDENRNGTLDRIDEYICSPRNFLDEDCSVNTTHLLQNSFSDYHRTRSDGTTYNEIGKGTRSGKFLQAEFEACKAKKQTGE